METRSAFFIEQQEADKKFDFAVLSDEKIWALFQSGHEGAFVYIYQKYVQQLFHYGRRFTSDRDLVKDCLQDLFIELRESDNLSKVKKIAPYLYGALRLKVLNALRKRSRSDEVLTNYKRINFKVDVSYESKLINSQLDQEQKEKLQDAISRLKTKHKELLYYFYYENYSYKEIAQIMNFGQIKSVRNLIYKILKRLKADF